MGLNETVNELEQTLKAGELVYVFGTEQMRQIRHMIDMVLVHFALLEKDEEVNLVEEDLQIARIPLDLCKAIVLEHPITDRLVEVVEGICKLVHNWNVNVGDDRQIHGDVKFLSNAIKQHYTIANAIEVLKVLIQSAKSTAKLDREISTISEHYLKALDAVNEGDDCGKTCSCN